jgi:thiol-disulfide isomerase/thioredoxin
MSTKAKYTLLVFWDATCSHCRETLPVLDSLYRVKWKKKGVRMYAVSVETDGTRAMWSTYIKEHHLEEWTHVYDSADDERALMSQGLKPVLQQYNVWYYPSFFLLDNDKHYMAKKLSYPKIAELVNSLFNNK